MCIFTEGTSKTFLNQNYAIALQSCYLFTNKMLNMELNMVLTVLMEFAELSSRFYKYLAI